MEAKIDFGISPNGEPRGIVVHPWNFRSPLAELLEAIWIKGAEVLAEAFYKHCEQHSIDTKTVNVSDEFVILSKGIAYICSDVKLPDGKSFRVSMKVPESVPYRIDFDEDEKCPKTEDQCREV